MHCEDTDVDVEGYKTIFKPDFFSELDSIVVEVEPPFL
jgi:hypothetical protein